jgi:hypothetical protein
MMSRFGDYINESLRPIEDQAKIHAFSNDFSKLLKKHDVSIIEGNMLFGFGDGWYWGIDRGNKTED